MGALGVDSELQSKVLPRGSVEGRLLPPNYVRSSVSVAGRSVGSCSSSPMLCW